MNRYPEEFYWLLLVAMPIAFLIVGAWLHENQLRRKWIRWTRGVMAGRKGQAERQPDLSEHQRRIDEAATLIEQRGWNWTQPKQTEK
jgi:hypothetical protein